jgi:hypothetical protein
MVETDDYDTKNDQRMGLIKKIANLRNSEFMKGSSFVQFGYHLLHN